MLLLGAGSLKPVTGCLPAFKAMSCCRMPPLPADLGGGPGQTFSIRRDVRLSVYAPQVSHHCTVPISTNTCFLPPVACCCFPPPSHLDAASFAFEADLALHLVHTQHRPDIAISIKCPPFAAERTFLIGLAALLLLPSAPVFFAALFL